jgi:hypothetical protein
MQHRPLNQRAAEQLMRNLRPTAFHTLALTGSQNNSHHTLIFCLLL